MVARTTILAVVPLLQRMVATAVRALQSTTRRIHVTTMVQSFAQARSTRVRVVVPTMARDQRAHQMVVLVAHPTADMVADSI